MKIPTILAWSVTDYVQQNEGISQGVVLASNSVPSSQRNLEWKRKPLIKKINKINLLPYATSFLNRQFLMGCLDNLPCCVLWRSHYMMLEKHAMTEIE